MSDYQVKVSLLNNPSSSLLAKADVTGKKMIIRGFCIFQGKDGKPDFVGEPAIKTGGNYVKIVEISDKALKERLFNMILAEYRTIENEHPSDFNEDGF